MLKFKSAFSKVHFVLMLFVAVNIVLGIVITLTPYTAAVNTIHLFAGLLILPALIASLLLIKNNKMVLKAFKARLLISKKDLAQKKPMVMISKGAAMLFGLGLVILLVNAILIKTGLAVTLFLHFNSLLFHVRFVYVMPMLAVLHAVTMKAADLHQHPSQKNKQVPSTGTR
jgi:hypothetical protein